MKKEYCICSAGSDNPDDTCPIHGLPGTKYICGSHTLYKKEKDAVCMVCGYIIKNYRHKELEMGAIEFKKFESRLYKYNHKVC